MVDGVVGMGVLLAFLVEALPCWEVAENVLSQSQHHPTLVGVHCVHGEVHTH